MTTIFSSYLPLEKYCVFLFSCRIPTVLVNTGLIIDKNPATKMFCCENFLYIFNENPVCTQWPMNGHNFFLSLQHSKGKIHLALLMEEGCWDTYLNENLLFYCEHIGLSVSTEPPLPFPIVNEGFHHFRRSHTYSRIIKVRKFSAFKNLVVMMKNCFSWRFYSIWFWGWYYFYERIWYST